MADPGQRIHPAGTDPRHGARPVGRGGPLDPAQPSDACGVGFVARASGARSHEVVALAVEAVTRVQHRGAASTDRSGDGAGLLTQIPHRLFHRDAYRLRLTLGHGRPFGVGALFLPPAPHTAGARSLVEEVLAADGIPCLGWREVPIEPAALGPTARASCPAIWQVLVGRPDHAADDDAWERALYLARREMEHRAAALELGGFYVCSLSCRTVVYKALLIGAQLAAFYPDLTFPEYESALAIFHQRYATNTLPSWALAQPFRLLAHNGEINTIWGNRNAMAMRAPMLAAPVWGGEIERLRDAIRPDGSDSASLDNAMELFVRSGRGPVHAAMMMIPQAWERYPDVEPEVRAFYEYHQCIHEPWDGPAAVAFSDGIVVAAAVDRNGLRPCRYKVRADGLVVAGSEVGLVDLDPREVVASGKVGPGEVFAVDTARSRVLRNLAAKREVATRRPYAAWVRRYMATLEPQVPTGTGGTPVPPSSLPQRSTAGTDSLPTSDAGGPNSLPSQDAGGPNSPPSLDAGGTGVPPVPMTLPLSVRQRLFGYGFEDVRLVLEPMGGGQGDPVWSMGDDTPIPPLARTAPSVYTFLRQRFAQVTNPPIDALRETMVMSLRMHLGRRTSPLLERPSAARMLRVEHPVLLPEEMAALRQVPGLRAATLDAVWPAAEGAAGLRPALVRLADRAARMVRSGVRLLVVSDRAADDTRAPIPLLLALGAVRQHLVRTGLRARVGLVAEAGDAFDVHHVAALIGYGAEAVHPWLAMETVGDARLTYRTAAEKGLLKVLAKMGISTLSSYCGAQIFEALGLGAEVVDLCFAGTVSPIGGLGFAELADDVLGRRRAALGAEPEQSLPDHGRVRFRKEGEVHGWAPPVVVALQQAVRTGSADAYGVYVAKSAGHPPATPRDLLTLRTTEPVPLDEVEPADAIRRRFIASAMSLGALSPEAHSTLSLAMNRMGAKSNSGEGGEDPASYHPVHGDRRDSRIKQVASARFGVTTEYLARADELEIKIAQGAKPGEGGQLPAHKVTDLIARLRHAVPGVQLISPPPHHDIYSIEDLAQLIHDLKAVNPRARVGVKLVAEAGVGTVAAGVAKAYADYVLIAGHSGGTGASPLSSIKHAGTPWELGLAETQQTLVQNGLRHRIEVRVDGGLRTGRDVLIAALLGAESFGFGTAALVALGCAMARQCHLNSCPTGIATQRPELRAKFKGTPEQVVAYFTFLAEEVRELLASLGARSLDEVIGRTDLLARAQHPDSPRAQLLDLSSILAAPAAGAPRHRASDRNDRPGMTLLDEEILEDLLPYVDSGLPFSASYAIRNHHLSVGARVAGTLAACRGDVGLPEGSIRLRFAGSAGQSFGAFTCRGMHLELEGEANDYVGKGLSGGEIMVRPFRRAGYAQRSQEHLIVGNTVLYGATAGRLFAAGQAGDRFAVRNSGAIAVIEGAGNHCCEYMTGGIVVVLGRVGRNFGAGMSNGLAYVLDEEGRLDRRLNGEMVMAAELEEDDERLLLRLIREHAERTMSPRARTILVEWERYRPMFRKVVARGAEELAAGIRRIYLDGAARVSDPAIEIPVLARRAS